ncbi:MAG TPA: hypothetical protein VMA34_21710 [Terracidiphilus sp.]|nr:hypothetical protein [Terracidiphilus sp.]
MLDLVIAYRVYPGVSKTPAAFSNDKFRLAGMCLRSFRKALGGLQVKVWALLDGCPKEYESLFRGLLQDHDLEILNLNKIGNEGTFGLQLDLLTNQSDAEYVFFAEDDYFYLPGALEKMLSFMRANPDADFVTPYDHPDSYEIPSRLERHHVRPFAGRYWRTASSTCLTFLASTRSLVRSEPIFRTYCRGNMDCPVWLALTRKHELADFRLHGHNRFWMKTWMKTWLWGYPSILFDRRYHLWTPLPALATHMESTGLAPVVDWQQLFLQDERETQT